MPKRLLITAAILCLYATPGLADLKPDALDCDPKKAARNAAMDATVGVSGKCDAKKVGKNTKEDLVDEAGDKLDHDGKHKKKHKNRNKDKD